jgi:hypothetical protein
MEAPDFRHHFAVHRPSLKRPGALMALLLLAGLCRGQFNAAEFDLKYSKKPYHFGIALGYNTTDFKVQHSDRFLLNDSILTARTANGPGFNLGIISNLRLGKRWDLRFIPSLVFAEKRLEYDMVEGRDQNKTIESIYMAFPVNIKFKSDPHKDFRVYAIAGANYTYDLASNAEARNAEDQVKIFRNDLSAEMGIGLELYFPYFIFSPEIKFSHGLLNVHARDSGLIFSDVIQNLFSRAITFTIHFEG